MLTIEDINEYIIELKTKELLNYLKKKYGIRKREVSYFSM